MLNRVMPAMSLGAGWRTWPNSRGRLARCCGPGSPSAFQSTNRL
jgi:hypothetical protein